MASSELSTTAPEEHTLGDLFSLRRPKDFKAGLSSGSKSLAKGVLGGAMSLIAAPVMGAFEGGLLGFGKGVLTGEASRAHVSCLVLLLHAHILVPECRRRCSCDPPSRGRVCGRHAGRAWRDRAAHSGGGDAQGARVGSGTCSAACALFEERDAQLRVWLCRRTGSGETGPPWR